MTEAVQARASAGIEPASPARRPALALLRSYALASAVAAGALALTALLEGPLHGAYFFLSLGSVVVVALYLGLGPSLVAVGVSTLGFTYLFLEPRAAFVIARYGDLYRMMGWCATALLVAWIGARFRAASEEARAAARRLEVVAASERRTRELYERLQAATAACSAARTFGEVAFALLETGLTHLRPSTANLATLDADGALRIVYSQGVPEAELARFPRIPLDAPLPAAECARERTLVTAVGGDEIDRRYPGLAEFRARIGFEALASIPVVVGGELQGVLGLAFSGPRALDDDERRFLGALADQAGLSIARARSYEAEARAREEAERIGRVKEQLLAVVGHDLRNPLSAIVNGASVMFRRGGLAPQDASTLRRIASSADRMTSVIRDLLDFSRVRQGLGIPVQLARVHLGEVAREVLVEFEDRPGAPAVALRAHGDLRLDADPQRMAQVLSNLVGNGLQHGEGTPVEVELRGEADVVLLRVRNAGPPIDPAALPHLFEPFRRGTSRDADAPEGASVGLGLFIVDAVVRAHGGTVTVASSAGEGTTFTVTLPRGRSPAGAARGA